MNAIQALSQLSYGPDRCPAPLGEGANGICLACSRSHNQATLALKALVVVLIDVADDVRDIVPFILIVLEKRVVVVVIRHFDVVVIIFFVGR